MGFWNDGITSPTRSRSRSPSRYKSSSSKHYSSRPAYSRSASSFFSLGGGGSSSRSYNGGSSRARPRSQFLSRIRKFLRDILSYMRRHPFKVFILVIMPLLTGGALTKILAQFGVRLPRGLESLAGGSRGMGGDRFYSRGGARDFEGGSALPGMGGGIGESLGSLMGIAKAFV